MNQTAKHTELTSNSKAVYGYEPYSSSANRTLYVKGSKTDYTYFGARYLDPDLSLWLSVDPLADKYPSMSPFMYTAGNPVMLVDPDGKKIINPYEIYKKYAELEHELRNKIKNASTWREKRKARKDLRANSDKIDGYNNYQKTEKLISDFKKKNENEFNRLNNLEFNGVEIDIVVNLNGGRGGKGQAGETKYMYSPDAIMDVIDWRTGDRNKLPTKIVDNKIEITLYRNGQILSTLANEFGDAIFAVENPSRCYEERINRVPYWDRSATNFSNKYQEYIMKGGDKPNPKEY